MKVLVIHDDASESGGANIYREQLSDIFKKHGTEVFLFSYNLKSDEDPTHAYCYKYRNNIKILRHASHKYFNPYLFFALRRWIRKARPDLIHIHHNYIFTTTVLLACQGKIPVVQTFHDHHIICPTGIGFTSDKKPCMHGFGLNCYNKKCISLTFYILELVPRMLRKFLLKRTVDALLAPSIDLKIKMESYGLNATLLRNYVDISKYNASPPNPKSNRILFVGRLYEGKGIEILLKAFRKVLEKIPDAALDLVGKVEADQKFEELASSLELNRNVTFHGPVPHEHLHKLYIKTNLVVLPAIWIENCPLVILEAMASGRPTIGSRVGGIPEIIIEGKTGLLCKPNDPDNLSNKILQLLQNKEMAEKMGKKGREMVEKNYSAELHSDKYLKIIQKLTYST